jgi:hypothetical protein
LHIRYTLEGACGGLELGVELFNEGCGCRVGKEDVNSFANLSEIRCAQMKRDRGENKTYDFLNVVHKIIEVDERQLGL